MQGRGSPSLPAPPNNSGCGDCPAPGFRDRSSSIHKLTGVCAKKQGGLPSPPGSRTVPAPLPRAAQEAGGSKREAESVPGAPLHPPTQRPKGMCGSWSHRAGVGTAGPIPLRGPSMAPTPCSALPGAASLPSRVPGPPGPRAGSGEPGQQLPSASSADR